MPHIRQYVTFLVTLLLSLIAAIMYPVERVLMPDVPSWSKMLLAAAVFFITFVLLLPVWLASVIPQRFHRTKRVLGGVSGLFLLLVGLAAVAYALLVAGMRVHLGVVAALGIVFGGWQLVEAVRYRCIGQNGETLERSDA